MTAFYYRRGSMQYAKGRAVYQGIATGQFSTGLRLFLKSGIATTWSAQQYNLVCVQREQRSMVALLDLTSTGTTIPGVNVSTINFDIGIEFTDIPLSALQTGADQGRFSLLFEPNT